MWQGKRGFWRSIIRHPAFPILPAWVCAFRFCHVRADARFATLCIKKAAKRVISPTRIHPRHHTGRRQPTPKAAPGRAETPTPEGRVPRATAIKRGVHAPREVYRPRAYAGEGSDRRAITRERAPLARGSSIPRGRKKAMDEGCPAAAACPRGVAARGKKRCATAARAGGKGRAATREGKRGRRRCRALITWAGLARVYDR